MEEKVRLTTRSSRGNMWFSVVYFAAVYSYHIYRYFWNFNLLRANTDLNWIKTSLVINPALPTERSIWTCIKTIHYRWSVRSIIVMYDTLCPEMCREHRCFQHSWLVCGERSVMLLSPVGWSCLYFSWQARTWSSGRNTVGSVWVVTVL